MALSIDTLPSNENVIQYYRSLQQFSKSSIDHVANQISKELIEIWTLAKIPTSKNNVKKQVKGVIEKGLKRMSKKTIRRSAMHGYRNAPEDCCIISSCRCFTKVKTKDEIGK